MSMLWFFAFTAVGIAVFALFLALNRIFKTPLLQLIGGTTLLTICGWLASNC